MKELKKKEAAGLPMRIDTESLFDFQTPIDVDFEPDEVVYVEMDDIMTLGIIAPLVGQEVPEPEIESLLGDVICPDDDDELSAFSDYTK